MGRFWETGAWYSGHPAHVRVIAWFHNRQNCSYGPILSYREGTKPPEIINEVRHTYHNKQCIYCGFIDGL